MPPTTLILIRHAATDLAGKLCGQLDPALNETGREQATALALSLKGWNVQRLYASDLQRAVQTALPLAELWNCPIEARTDLREISFGAWEGKSWAEVRSNSCNTLAIEASPELSAPGGETSGSFRDRILRALAAIAGDSGGHTSAIVTHLGVMRVILSELRLAGHGWDHQQRIGYCAVYRIRIDGVSSELIDLHR